jgi:CRISPR-associated endoribonuclease Cas6
MRLYFKIQTSNQTIPFDHQPLLTGTIYKWLGRNKEHGKVSLYSFSQLSGGRMVDKGFKFEGGTSFFFSSYDSSLIKMMIAGIHSSPEMFCGFIVSEIIIQQDPDLSNRNVFSVASPIFIKRRVGESIEHILYNDPRANNFLKETLTNKMNREGLIDESLDIRFDTSYRRASTKKITYKGVENRANWCPVIIEGKPLTKLFAWNVGLGNSTGIGFGAIK